MRIFNFLLGMLLLCLFSCQKAPKAGRELLENTKEEIESLTAVSFNQQMKASGMGDMETFRTYVSEVKCFENEEDALLGVNYIAIYDEGEGGIAYDGTYLVSNRKGGKSMVDTIATNPYARPMLSFFQYANNLLQYSLINVPDSLLVYSMEGDCYCFDFAFEDIIVEFSVQKDPWIMEQKGELSSYKFWLSKETGLPVKIRRHMSHQISIDSIYDFKRIEPIEHFSALDYIPDSNVVVGKQAMNMVKPNLEGMQAVSWVLKSVGGDSVSFSDFTQDVILMEFTAVGCGPCKAAIPFLKQLRKDFKNSSFEVISLETFPRDITGLEKYKIRNDIDYPYLESNKILNETYGIKGFPVFLVIDKDHNLHKILSGFSNNGQDVREAIEACF